jgi:hypothetical protein
MDNFCMGEGKLSQHLHEYVAVCTADLARRVKSGKVGRWAFKRPQPPFNLRPLFIGPDVQIHKGVHTWVEGSP